MENQSSVSNETNLNENLAKLYIPASIADSVPSMVKNELKKLSAQKQDEFVEEYRRKQKSVGIAYLCWLIFGLHYGYVGKWGLQVVYWLTAGGFLIWALVDLFRIPGMIGNHNKDAATDVMRNLKAIS
ncbi:MAG: TM2 domain-containing protein [Bergeyella sp.]